MSRLFFSLCAAAPASGRRPGHEYAYHLPQLGVLSDTKARRCRRQPALLHARTISRAGGSRGRVPSVGARGPIRKVLSRNLRRCANAEIVPYALGTENKPITMANDSARETGYFGTGQNFVNDGGEAALRGVSTARMRRDIAARPKLERLDFVKCDIRRAMRVWVMNEMRPLLLEKFRPRCRSKRGVRYRPQIVALLPLELDTRLHARTQREAPLTNSTDIIFRYMRIDILTVVPELLTSPLHESILKRAQEKGLVEIVVHNLHDYAHDKRKTTDDYPFGGEAGMVMKCEPVVRGSWSEAPGGGRTTRSSSRRTASGTTSTKANRLSTLENIIILCGHYKGIDHRIREHLVTREISIGDYVLTGGELAACIIADSVVRIIPGAIGDEASALTDSFQDNLLAPRSRGLRSSAAGGFPTCCCRGISPRSKNGRTNKPTNAPGACAPIYSMNSL